MTIQRSDLTRREFLGVAATTAAAATLAECRRASPPTRKSGRRSSRSTATTLAPPGGAKAFKTFLDYFAEQGIKGKSSLILGMGGASITANPPTTSKCISNRSAGPGLGIARRWN